MANIFKIDQFKGLDKPVGSARVIGSGASMSIPIHTTGYSIRVSPLLSAIVGQLSSAVRDARVEVIDTSPISRADVVGLAKYEIIRRRKKNSRSCHEWHVPIKRTNA